MKNTNYNVLKLLHGTLDDLWRIEKHYLKDAKGGKCGCVKLMKRMRQELAGQAEDLRSELSAHMKANKLS